MQINVHYMQGKQYSDPCATQCEVRLAPNERASELLVLYIQVADEHAVLHSKSGDFTIYIDNIDYVTGIGNAGDSAVNPRCATGKVYVNKNPTLRVWT